MASRPKLNDEEDGFHRDALHALVQALHPSRLLRTARSALNTDCAKRFKYGLRVTLEARGSYVAVRLVCADCVSTVKIIANPMTESIYRTVPKSSVHPATVHGWYVL